MVAYVHRYARQQRIGVVLTSSFERGCREPQSHSGLAYEGHSRHEWRLDQLHCCPLHVIVDIDVALCGGDALVTSERSQHPYADALAGQCGDERAPTTVTAGPVDTCMPVQPPHKLAKGVASESISLLCPE